MSKTVSSRMGVRRSRRPADLGGGGNEHHADVDEKASPANQNTHSISTPRKPSQHEQQPVKAAQSGSKDRPGRRRSSKQAVVHAESDAAERRIVVVGEKATALPRAEAGVGRNLARKEVT